MVLRRMLIILKDLPLFQLQKPSDKFLQVLQRKVNMRFVDPGEVVVLEQNRPEEGGASMYIIQVGDVVAVQFSMIEKFLIKNTAARTVPAPETGRDLNRPTPARKLGPDSDTSIFYNQVGICKVKIRGTTIARLSDGDYFGEQTALGFSDKYTATITAETLCLVHVLSRESIREALTLCPNELHIFKNLSERRKSLQDGVLQVSPSGGAGAPSSSVISPHSGGISSEVLRKTTAPSPSSGGENFRPGSDRSSPGGSAYAVTK